MCYIIVYWISNFILLCFILYIYAFSRRFYPKRLTLHSSYSFYILSALAFPGNRSHYLGVASNMLYYLSYRKANIILYYIILIYLIIFDLTFYIVFIYYSSSSSSSSTFYLSPWGHSFQWVLTCVSQTIEKQFIISTKTQNIILTHWSIK